MRSALVLFAFNRPAHLASTAHSLNRALSALAQEAGSNTNLAIHVAIDGARSHPYAANDEAQKVDASAQTARALLPSARIRREVTNRGLPAHLIAALDDVFHEADRAICIEDDIEMSATTLLALLRTSDELTRTKRGALHVVGAAPQHRDGSLEHQALLVTREAHEAVKPLLSDYIQRFALDGAEHPNGYGRRDHQGIYEWSGAIARSSGLSEPRGTSQDRMRELGWRRAGVTLRGLPMRLVRHRGLWGQHNTPWHALRTGQLFQRLDARPWNAIESDLVRWLSEIRD